MPILTIEGTIKNGRIELSENILLPENALVYVVIPSLKVEARDKENSKDFEKIVEEDL